MTKGIDMPHAVVTHSIFFRVMKEVVIVFCNETRVATWTPTEGLSVEDEWIWGVLGGSAESRNNLAMGAAKAFLIVHQKVYDKEEHETV